MKKIVEIFEIKDYKSISMKSKNSKRSNRKIIGTIKLYCTIPYQLDTI